MKHTLLLKRLPGFILLCLSLCGCQSKTKSKNTPWPGLPPKNARKVVKKVKRPAPPRPLVQRKEGTLSIKSEPEGALVFINGKGLGRTPFVRVLPVGRYRMIVKKEGFLDEVAQFEVKDGQAVTQWVELKRGPRPKKAKPSRSLRDRLLAGKLVWIAPGSFLLGAPESERGLWMKYPLGIKGRYRVPMRSLRQRKGFLPEIRKHVEISQGFWMMQTEVTQHQFSQALGYNPSFFRACGGECPVENVTWHEALLYANALSQKHRLKECYVCFGAKKQMSCEVKNQYKRNGLMGCPGFRLPTEAEWEYAARAGEESVMHGKIAQIAWFRMNARATYKGCHRPNYLQFDTTDNTKKFPVDCAGIQPVATKMPNGWGLYDMLGNVEEWTGDEHPAPEGANGHPDAEFYVLRGGHYFGFHYELRATHRILRRASFAERGAGFRLVRTGPAPRDVPSTKPTTQPTTTPASRPVQRIR